MVPSLIEGIGDEVLVFFVLASLFLLLSIAWLSTHVADPPPVGIIFVENSRLRRLIRLFSLRPRGGATGRGARPPSPRAHSDAGTANEQVAADAAAGSVTAATKTAKGASGGTGDNTNGSNGDADASSVDASVDGEREVQQVAVPSAASDVDVTSLSSAATDAVSPPHVSEESPPSVTATEARLPTAGAELPAMGAELHVTKAELHATEAELHVTGVGLPATGAGLSVTESELPATEAGLPTTEAELPATEAELPATGAEPTALDQITIRLKYLDDRQRVVQAKPNDTIGGFKRTHFGAELADNFAVRFVCNGQELRGDGCTLESYNITDNSVIHCLLTRGATGPGGGGAPAAPGAAVGVGDAQIGQLMGPLFGLILVLIWYSRFTFRNYFNVTSTAALLGITLLYALSLFARLRPARPRPPHAHAD